MNNNYKKIQAIKAVDVKAYKNALNPETLKTYKKIYGIKDNLIDFQEVFFAPNDGIATRNFGDAVKRNPNTNLAKHPENFELWKIANMDGETGEIIKDLKMLATASDFIENEMKKSMNS